MTHDCQCKTGKVVWRIDLTKEDLHVPTSETMCSSKFLNYNEIWFQHTPDMVKQEHIEKSAYFMLQKGDNPVENWINATNEINKKYRFVNITCPICKGREMEFILPPPEMATEIVRTQTFCCGMAEDTCGFKYLYKGVYYHVELDDNIANITITSTITKKTCKMTLYLSELERNPIWSVWTKYFNDIESKESFDSSIDDDETD